MSIKTFTFNPFATNCFIASSEGEAAIVDPSCHSSREVDAIDAFIQDKGVTVKHILLTHAHIDHIFGCAALTEKYGVGIQVHVDDEPLLIHGARQAEMFGLHLDDPGRPESYLSEGDQIKIGSLTWHVIHTPGHSPGSVSFVDREGCYVIAGDVLFAGSIGRTDLWQGSLPILMQSIFQKIVPLGEDFIVYSGHGSETTIGREVSSNTFLSGSGHVNL